MTERMSRSICLCRWTCCIMLLVWVAGCDQSNAEPQPPTPVAADANEQVTRQITAQNSTSDHAPANPTQPLPKAKAPGDEFVGGWASRDSKSRNDIILITKSGDYYTVQCRLMGDEVKLNGTYAKGALTVTGPSGPIIITYDKQNDSITFLKEYLRLAWHNYMRDEQVLSALEQGLLDVNEKDRKGRTALHYANNEPYARVLIQHGADVNARNNAGETPLHRSLYNGGIPVAKVLIESGADVNAKDQEGRTTLHLAVSLGGSTGMELFNLLLRSGADLNVQDQQGNTLLHTASGMNRTGMVEALLAAGAKVDLVNNMAQTALHHAGQSEVVDLLVNKGADVNSLDRVNRTPLHYRADQKAGDTSAAEALLRHGATLNAKDMHNDTPMTIASRNGYEAMLRLLASHSVSEAGNR